MRVIAVTLLLGACLSPGDAPPDGGLLYGKADQTPPTILKIEPDILSTVGDGGSYQSLTPGQTITITFSETMDPASLVPGILIFKDDQQISLDVQADSVDSFVTDPLVIPDNDIDFHVRIQPAGTTFQSGAHLLRLSTVLVDVAGNPLQTQFENFFFVQ